MTELPQDDPVGSTRYALEHVVEAADGLLRDTEEVDLTEGQRRAVEELERARQRASTLLRQLGEAEDMSDKQLLARLDPIRTATHELVRDVKPALKKLRPLADDG